MDRLVPCDQEASLQLVKTIGNPKEKRGYDYVAKTFPSIMADITRLLAEKSTRDARETQDVNEATSQQLKPYFAFSHLLGKCPQITSLMYKYFRNSSFQPLPEKLFTVNKSKKIEYSWPGITDEVLKEILITYVKYLSFDACQFSSIWNWSELGRIIANHTNPELRFLAASCLSIIFLPTRAEHKALILSACRDDYQKLIDLQIKFRHIYSNTFKLIIDPEANSNSQKYAQTMGLRDSGYEFCSDSFVKLSNVLLPKRELDNLSSAEKSRYDIELKNYVPVDSMSDAISRLAYCISINRACIVKGPIGSGKSALLDYVAASTNRIKPPHYIKVQICDQIDSRILVGSYVSTEIPGQFEWQPGPLTQAMLDGSWIVFEDIGTASPDVIQVLHSVIENGNLTCISTCPIKLTQPNPDFRILFTMQTNSRNNSDVIKFIERSCDIIEISHLTNNELCVIMDTKYQLNNLSIAIIKVYDKVISFLNEEATRGQIRQINLQDLFKLCRRLQIQRLKLVNGKIDTRTQELLLLDLIDCFLAHKPGKDMITMANMIGNELNLPINEVHRLLLSRTPKVFVDNADVEFGRVRLIVNQTNDGIPGLENSVAYTQRILRLMEGIAQCLKLREPVLLVGETGVGKTSIVQHMASTTGNKLIVVNLSQQSDSSDLLGGFKPVQMRELMKPLHSSFEELFTKIYDPESNKKFLEKINSLFMTAKKLKDWASYLKTITRISSKPITTKQATKEICEAWLELNRRAKHLSRQVHSRDDRVSLSLSFSDGTLLRAVKEGHWILLDEVNLAEADVLQCLIFILDSMSRSEFYLQTPANTIAPIIIHPSFRVFACMNPSTDIGKRELDASIRARFTEFFVEDITEKKELRMVVESYAKSFMTPQLIEKVVTFYQEMRARSNLYSDNTGHSPVYSLRTLCRALVMCSGDFGASLDKMLYESLRVTFLDQLDDNSQIQVGKLLEQSLFSKKSLDELQNTNIAMPKDNHTHIDIEGYWIRKGTEDPSIDKKYVMTDSVHKNLGSLARIIFMSQRKLPILIQGNTSVGKTSLITYLAERTGNKCYRINNHEHTDLQEYVGRYVLRENGEITFQEGMLVKAMRKGYWIILDELNLAPSELLEALNRVLDDNRELFVPEIQETIKAHPKFMLFATQNPPGEYAGRKFLSRAFRNRFSELHFADLPTKELEIILQEKCEMPPQYAKKIVSVMRELQMRRRESGCFNGKQSYMTVRDLLRWGQRYLRFKTCFKHQYCDWETQLAQEGLVLLEARVRSPEEGDIVKEVIEKVFKRSLSREKIYELEQFSEANLPEEFKHIYLSHEFKRVYVQLSRALKHNEPVLLCGQTGCGKTTACQLYARMASQDLKIYNCHMGTESSDFIGSVRPIRDSQTPGEKQLFPWMDGPLVEAMKRGSMFLMDEISLADDAVLERINSVLEQPRKITLAEKAGEIIHANEEFNLVATMNPGGDYGKKELSPALRNRFTEIYCHNTVDIKQIVSIIRKSLEPHLLQAKYAPKIFKTIETFLSSYYNSQDFISIRDISSLCQFLNKSTQPNQIRPLSIQEALVNAASLVFFDQLGTCGYKNSLVNSDDMALKFKLKAKLDEFVITNFGAKPKKVPKSQMNSLIQSKNKYVRFKKFLIPRGPALINRKHLDEFICDSATVAKNLIKIARAMQLDRPILLEGDPGVGKTSIVTALAKLTGHEVVRINLSEQTDLNDLFGSDLPDTSLQASDSPRFVWSDGPLLKAIKDSKWILLDEMNLASQSVLEGLNSCLDHRGEIFIPELDRKFDIDRSESRIFACQNPYSQGGARKGLPRSFLNRFTSIYVKPHSAEDLVIIIRNLYPSLPRPIAEKMIEFNNYVNSVTKNHLGQEFNLRNIIYWCDLMTHGLKGLQDGSLYKPDRFVQFAYLDGIRSNTLRNDISEKFEDLFGYPVYEPAYREIRVGECSINLNRSILPRNLRLQPHLSQLCILKYQMPFMESISKAIEFNKMPIIIGKSGVGKRSMIRILAGLSGNLLNVMSANREMDTIELLGSYEQRNLQRQILDIISRSKNIIISITNSVHRKDQSWIQIFQYIWSCFFAFETDTSEYQPEERICSFREQLIPIRDLLQLFIPTIGIERECEIKQLIGQIEKIVARIDQFEESPNMSGNFDWIDSILLKSVREGTWLMIEDANMMNPATLDRLNSLIEKNGYLCLNEKGSGSDAIEMVVPHKGFRLILTMDPDNGELSRAMRNRGVEIYVQTDFFFEDFLLLVDQNGFTPEESASCMLYTIMQTCYDVHNLITDEKPEEGGYLLTLFGLNYISRLSHQLRRGCDINTTLSSLLINHYNSNGFADRFDPDEITRFVKTKMFCYGNEFKVKKSDERYYFMNFKQDLMALTGGDADVAMVERDNKVFYDETRYEKFLKPGEILEFMDVVNTCSAAKIFIEMSTRGDFDYRRGFILVTFSACANILPTIAKQINDLSTECLSVLKNMMPKCTQVPVNELPFDTRNFPDIHHMLQCLNHDVTVQNIELQNRWLLSLQRVSLNMIVEFIELRTVADDFPSLFLQSEKLKNGEISREHLIRPAVEIVSDLYHLLNGILRFISNRCFDDSMISKVMARSFWISYLICKLKRGYNQQDFIAVSNQLPMLWALTYQKVIGPIVEECDIANQTYKNRKFANRIEQVTHFLDVNIDKATRSEKQFHKKVVNKHAMTFKLCEKLSREVDRIFAKIVIKSEDVPLEQKMNELIAYSGCLWSNSEVVKCLYFVEDKLIHVGLEMCSVADCQNLSPMAEHSYALAMSALEQQMIMFKQMEDDLQKDMTAQLLHKNRQFNALDHFAPIWQHKLLAHELTRLDEIASSDQSRLFISAMGNLLKSVHGVVISPRFFNHLMSYLQHNCARSDTIRDMKQSMIFKRDLELYVNYLFNLLPELSIVFDHQLVTWTKLRSTTSNLSPIAPLLPEFAPIISLTASYSLDMNHLKLNSYLSSISQLESLSVYLIKNYSKLKSNANDEDKDTLRLAKKFHLLRNRVNEQEIVEFDAYLCDKNQSFSEQIKAIEKDHAQLADSIRLAHYGYLISIEYAPIFTLDPALKTREKLEVYKSELAHIKLDLYFKNTLSYWRTGENLQLNEIDGEDAVDMPLATKILVERKSKLENSIAKLRLETFNRPKSDDGSLYFELRKTIEMDSHRLTLNWKSLMQNFTIYMHEKKPEIKYAKLTNVICLVRTMIKNLEKTVARLRSEYALYTDLLSYYLTGIGFMNQGLRNLYFNLESRKQLQDIGFSRQEFINNAFKLFSFVDFKTNQLESVRNKIEYFSQLTQICRPEDLNKCQSALINSVLVQMRHHIVMSPSDIYKCMPIIRRIMRFYEQAWLARKEHIEKQLKERAKIYEYKTHKNILGTEISVGQQEFLELCSRFPTYEHVFEEFLEKEKTLKTHQDNLQTEQRIINMNQSADLSSCNQICKSHYKLMMEASRNLIGSHNNIETYPTDNHDDEAVASPTREYNINESLSQETDCLFQMIRNKIDILDYNLDPRGIEYYIMASHKVLNVLGGQVKKTSRGTLSGSIQMLDEDVFNVYHDGNPQEALTLQRFMTKVDRRVCELRKNKGFDNSALKTLIKIMIKINKFLIHDPMMKFITGAHALLDYIEEWNTFAPTKEDRMTEERDELLRIIQTWRGIELESWKNSLHWVKRNYIDKTLCDLWFYIQGAFSDPLACATKVIRVMSGQDDFEFSKDTEEFLYMGFASFIKNFLEEATLGDYRLRLDLIHANIIEAKFNAHKQGSELPQKMKMLESEQAGVVATVSEPAIQVDTDKLIMYAYNLYKQYNSLFEKADETLKMAERDFIEDLNTEIKIVAWQNRKILEVKNAFRISHRKLNSVMSKYLNVLQKQIPCLATSNHSRNQQATSTTTTTPPPVPSGEEISQSDALVATLGSIDFIIQETNPYEIIVDKTGGDNYMLSSLSNKFMNDAVKLKVLNGEIFSRISEKYADNLTQLEQNQLSTLEDIQNFYNQEIHKVVIHSKDSSDEKREKEKLCRQIYHSKKFALQSIFKTLRELGLSHQRGSNQADLLDSLVLSMESTRDFLHKKPQMILESAEKLVTSSDILYCNEKFQKIISYNMALQAQPKQDDLSSDQLTRIRGYAIDLIMSLIASGNGPARIYQHLLEIQAGASSLNRVKQEALSSKESRKLATIYNFNLVHGSIDTLNNYVNKSITLFSKLQELSKCCEVAFSPESVYNLMEELNIGQEEHLSALNEKKALQPLIGKIHESFALMTPAQLEHLTTNIGLARKSMIRINGKLKDLLLNEREHYVFTQSDVDELRSLYDQYVVAMKTIILDENQQSKPNLEAGLALGSILELIEDAKRDMDAKFAQLTVLPSATIHEAQTNDKPDYLTKRALKLVKSVKLATQCTYKLETDSESDGTSQVAMSVTARKTTRSKPFNFIRTHDIERNLQLDSVKKCLERIILTLNCNSFGASLLANEIVRDIAPVMNIYIQTITAYLNIMFSCLKVKLTTAFNIIPFFTDLGANGFGLPYKLDDSQGQAKGARGNGKMSEDNAGFGDGQGETDASKKIEFESQLDELRDKQQNSETGEIPEDDDDHIEAIDDAIEMSDDFGGVARGPDEKLGADQNGEDEASDDDQDDETLKELDKELGQVDDDEQQLDNKLWSDNENDDDLNMSDDDERDLKDFLSENKIDEENKMQAKDESLVKQTKQQEKEDQNKDLGANEAKANDGDEDAVNNEKPLEPPEAAAEVDDGDMCEDMDIETPQSGEEEKALSEDVEMDKNNADPKDDGQPPEGGDEIRIEIEVQDDVNLDNVDVAPADEKGEADGDSQMELDNIESIPEMSDGEIPSSQEQLDDDVIDKQLEKEIEFPVSSQPLVDPINDLGGGRDAMGQSGSNQQNDMDKKNKKENLISGSYAVFDERPEDPLDDGDEGLEKNLEQLTSSNEITKDRQQQDKQLNDDQRQAPLAMDIDDDQNDPMPKDSEIETSDKTKQQDERKSAKRTPAASELQAQDRLQQPSKRPRMNDRDNRDHEADRMQPQEGAKDDDNDATEEINKDKLPENVAFKHVPVAANNQFEVIDLCDSDEDDNIELMNESPEDNGQDDTLKKLVDKPRDERQQISSFDMSKPENVAHMWFTCLRNANSLVHELCQQLQIVLQPTKMSKYKGDYKSGKRLNMRKIIAYVASNYRKDKIWLRKTKPSKRTYSICLAVDNSSSMSENNCRQMTYESLALLAKSLSIIEAGSLNVVSFGDQVKTIHEFDETYHDSVGPKWLAELPFDETKTNYAELLKHSCEKFSKRAQASHTSGSQASQLLIIISDGRNVSHEEQEIKLRLRELSSMRVVTLFVVVDDMKKNKGKSITDVKKPLGFNAGGPLEMVNYMEVFPFPHYLLLRKLESMPATLGDVLRQWFEAVTQDN